jgi:hypothetical protein
MSFHQSTILTGKSDDTWITPMWLLEPLGKFDLDPCCPEVMPWRTANKVMTIVDDGLISPWFGRVWLNPPYGRETGKWLEKLSNHGNGLALVNARTDTRWFHDMVWMRSHSVFFLKKRVFFCRPDGSIGKSGSGCGSCLISYDWWNTRVLEGAGFEGYLVRTERADG